MCIYMYALIIRMQPKYAPLLCNYVKLLALSVPTFKVQCVSVFGESVETPEKVKMERRQFVRWEVSKASGGEPKA